MGKISGAQAIKRLEARYNFRTAKALGQNFLSDPSVIDDMAAASGCGPEDLVIEIGPGLGVLTQVLAENAGKVVAIEIDDKLIPILQETLRSYPNTKVIHNDVLKVDMRKLIQEERILPGGGEAKNIRVVGNIPYYITTPIIMGLLEAQLPIESITVMVQKEVADRMIAKPGKPAYSVLTLSLNYYGEAEYIRTVPSDCFLPAPKVDSAVVNVRMLPSCPVDVKSKDVLDRCIKAGFGQRRKTLLNSLSGGGFGKDNVSTALRAAGIDPKRRAETLSLEEFAQIANQLSD